MPSPFGPLRLIVNPRAGGGAVGRTLPVLLQELRGHGVDADAVEIAPGGAAGAARQALDDGIRYLVAAGGDGTVHGVVNGMFDVSDDERSSTWRPLADDAIFGVAASGSRCDFARTFGLDRSAEVVARHLASDHSMPIDVGVVAYTDARGRRAQRLFANVAEVGYGAELLRRAARYPRFLGRVRYLLGAYAAIAALHRQETAVTVAQAAPSVPVVNLVVANCQFLGGGMKVAPRALPDDGRFNVQVFTGERSQVFTLTMKLYRGEHLPDPHITEWQSPTVSIAPPDPLPVAADGEVLGTTPASFWLLERALRLKI